MLLVQAEQEKESGSRITVDAVRQHLLHNGINEDAIKIATGKTKELDTAREWADVNSPVRVIITVDALKEGWDFSHAQVLCSFKTYKNQGAVTQIIGRIMRMHGGRSASQEALNRAYVYTHSPEFGQTAKLVVSGLQSMYGTSIGSAAMSSAQMDGSADGMAVVASGYGAISSPSADGIIYSDDRVDATNGAALAIPIWMPAVFTITGDEALEAVGEKLAKARAHLDHSFQRINLSEQSDGRSVMISDYEPDQDSWSAHLDVAEFVRGLALRVPYVSVADVAAKFTQWDLDGWDTVAAVNAGNEAVHQLVNRKRELSINDGQPGERWYPPPCAVVDKNRRDSRFLYGGWWPQDINVEEDNFINWYINSSGRSVHLWMRNPEITNIGYAIPTPYKNHYPDFLVLMEDGSVIALEYKGEHLLGNQDTENKQVWGNRWAQLMSEKNDTTYRYEMWRYTGKYVQMTTAAVCLPKLL